jgi:plastocyanin
VTLKTTAAPVSTTRKAPLLPKLAALALLGVLVVLAGCGSSSSSSTSSSSATETAPAQTPATTPTTSGGTAPAAGAGSKIALEANPEGQLKYNTTSLSAKAGAVTIDFKNSSPVGHDVSIESSSKQVVGATPVFTGGSKSVTVNLKPGTYKFFCSVPGHRQAGMEGTLIV